MEKNKEVLQQIIKDTNREDIVSFEDTFFIIYLGNIKNTNIRGYEYYLLETYLQIPYTFAAQQIKLHRGIVDVTEVARDGHYSGFTHYDGNSFCWGESGVSVTTANIGFEGLTEDNFEHFLINFERYLSFSNHETIGDYVTSTIETESKEEITVKEYVFVNGLRIPSLLEIEKNVMMYYLDYSAPFTFKGYAHEKKNFTFKGETIIPKIVEHQKIPILDTSVILKKVPVHAIIKSIKKETIKKHLNEIDNTPRYNIQNLLHKLSNKYSGVDGSLYI